MKNAGLIMTVLLLLLFAACGGGEKTQPPAESAEPAQESAEPVVEPEPSAEVDAAEPKDSETLGEPVDISETAITLLAIVGTRAGDFNRITLFDLDYGTDIKTAAFMTGSDTNWGIGFDAYGCLSDNGYSHPIEAFGRWEAQSSKLYIKTCRMFGGTETEPEPIIPLIAQTIMQIGFEREETALAYAEDISIAALNTYKKVFFNNNCVIETTQYLTAPEGANFYRAWYGCVISSDDGGQTLSYTPRFKIEIAEGDFGSGNCAYIVLNNIADTDYMELDPVYTEWRGFEAQIDWTQFSEYTWQPPVE